MVTNVAHTAHLVFEGQSQQVQSWSFGFWFRYLNSGLGTELPSSESVATDLTSNGAYTDLQDTFMTALAGKMAGAQGFTGVRAEVYGEDPTTPTVMTRGHVLPGSGGAYSVPPECAVVASLRSSRAGASGRGRAYFPLNGMSVDANGQVAGGDAILLATATATFLTSTGNHANFSPGTQQYQIIPTVVSRTHQLTSDVGAVIVDQRWDAQRRREDKLLGADHIAAVAVIH